MSNINIVGIIEVMNQFQGYSNNDLWKKTLTRRHKTVSNYLGV